MSGLTSVVQAALNRLDTYYDGNLPYNPNTNPGGMRNGGHRKNFVPALVDFANVILAIEDLVTQALAAGKSVQDTAAIAQPLLSQAVARLQDALAAVNAAEAARDRAIAAESTVTGDFLARLKGTLPGLPTEPPPHAGEPYLNGDVVAFTRSGLAPGVTPSPSAPLVHIVASDELDANLRLTRALSFAFH